MNYAPRQNTPEWLEWRKDKIGASDAPIIMGVSPWCTPLLLWKRKLGLATEQTETPAMQNGRKGEVAALEKYNKTEKADCIPQVVVHKNYPWMIASLDGVNFESGHFVEIKCPGAEDHKCAERGTIPAKYIPQLQHQMEVCDIDSIDYMSYNSKTGDHVLLTAYRDKKYIESLLEKEKAFIKCILDMDEPPHEEADNKNEYEELEDPQVAELLDRYLQYSMWAKEWEVHAEQAKSQIIELIGGKNVRIGAHAVVKTTCKGAVDYASVPELEGVDLEKYRKKEITKWCIKLLK